MSSVASIPVAVPSELVEAIRSFPAERMVEHCGAKWPVSPFDIYSPCPHCGAEIKVRSFSGCAEIEDVFHAVSEWMNQPGVEELIQLRRQKLASDA